METLEEKKIRLVKTNVDFSLLYNCSVCICTQLTVIVDSL